MTISGYNPIQFHKDENLIWVFNDCTLLEHHKSVAYVGASGGFSVRVAKGVYCHTSSSRGHRVEHDHLVRTATGNLAITSKNIYFSSSVKSMRIPMRNVVAVNLFTDAIQISKSNTGAPANLYVGRSSFCSELALAPDRVIKVSSKRNLALAGRRCPSRTQDDFVAYQGARLCNGARREARQTGKPSHASMGRAARTKADISRGTDLSQIVAKHSSGRRSIIAGELPATLLPQRTCT